MARFRFGRKAEKPKNGVMKVSLAAMGCALILMGCTAQAAPTNVDATTYTNLSSGNKVTLYSMYSNVENNVTPSAQLVLCGFDGWGNIYGANAKTGAAENNSVTIKGGKVTGTVYGGYTADETEDAANNTIAIEVNSNTVADLDLTGATLVGNDMSWGYSSYNNNLDLTKMEADVTVKSIKNFSNIIVAENTGILTSKEKPGISSSTTIDATKITTLDGFKDNKRVLIKSDVSLDLPRYSQPEVLLNESLDQYAAVQKIAVGTNYGVALYSYRGVVDDKEISIAYAPGEEIAGIYYTSDGKGHALNSSGEVVEATEGTLVIDTKLSDDSKYGAYAEGAIEAKGGTLKIVTGGYVSAAYGGKSETGNVTGNAVIIDGGEVGGVSGGYSWGGSSYSTDNYLVSGNSVKMISGKVVNALNGGSSHYGDANNNTVEIEGGEVGNMVYGGDSMYGSANYNEVTISGGKVTNSINGGDAKQEASSNTVTVKSTAIYVGNNIYGGHTEGTVAKDNTVNFEDGTVTNGLYGGSADGKSSTVTGNKVDVSGGSIGSSLYGGYSGGNYDMNDDSIVTGNTVTITGGTLKQTTVAAGGAYGKKVTIKGNAINISGGTFGANCYVYAGYAKWGGGTITGNKITLTSTSEKAPDLAGATLYGSGSAPTKLVTGDDANLLDLTNMAVSLTAKSIKNFNEITFGANTATLTTTDGGNLNYTTIDATAITSAEGFVNNEQVLLTTTAESGFTNIDTAVLKLDETFINSGAVDKIAVGDNYGVAYYTYAGNKEATKISIKATAGDKIAGIYYTSDGKGHALDADNKVVEATSGKLTISSGLTTDDKIYAGAYAEGSNDAKGGTLEITQGGIDGAVYAGYSESGKVIGNTIIVVADGIDLRYVGLYGSNKTVTAKAVAGEENVLDLTALTSDSRIRDLKNFDVIKLGNATVTVPLGAALDYATLDLSAVKLSVGESKALLIGLTGTDTATITGTAGGYALATGTVDGVTRIEGLSAELTSSALTATYNATSNVTAGLFVGSDGTGRKYDSTKGEVVKLEDYQSDGSMTIKDATVGEAGKIFAGAYAEGNNDVNGKLTIDNAKVTGDVYGTYTTKGTALGGEVTLQGADTVVTGNVYGSKDANGSSGTVNWESGTVTGNVVADTVNITGTNNVVRDKVQDLTAKNISVAKGASLTYNGDLDLTNTTKLTVAGTLAVGADITYNTAAKSIVAEGGSVTATSNNFVNSDLTALAAATNAITTDKDTTLNVVFDAASNTTYTTAQLMNLKKAYYPTLAEATVLKDAQLNLVNATLKIDDNKEKMVIKRDSDATGTEITINTTPQVVDKNNNIKETVVAVVPQSYVTVAQQAEGEEPVLQTVEKVTIASNFASKGLQVASETGKVDMIIKGSVTMTGGSDEDSSIVVDANGKGLETDIVVEKDAYLAVGVAANTAEQKGKLGKVAVHGEHAIVGNDATKTDYAYEKLTIKSEEGAEAATVAVTNAGLTVKELSALDGNIFVDPAYLAINSLTDNTLGVNLYVSEGSVTNIAGDATELREATEAAGLKTNDALTGFTVASDKTVLGIDGNISVAKKLIVDSAVDSSGNDTNNTTGADVYFGNGSLFVVNGEKAESNPVINLANKQNVKVESGAKLYLRNALGKKEYTILANANNITVDGWGETTDIKKTGETTLYANRLLKYTAKVDGGSYIVTTLPELDPSVFKGALVYPALKEMADKNLLDADSSYGGIKFLSRATDATYIGDAQMTPVMDEMATIAATSGVQHTALRASDLVVDTIGEHLTAAKAEKGANLWATPLRTSLTTTSRNESTANISGIMVGYDNGNEKGRFGVAIQGGWGTSHSEGTVSYYQNKNKFAGVSLYGSQKIGKFDLKASLGYTKFGNDVRAHLASGLNMGTVNTDIDAKAFTADVRVERTYETKSGLGITPHVGLRYTRLSTDSYDNYIISGDSEKQNIWQLPIGVTFAQTLSKKEGWTLRPYLDLSFVPAFGGKESDSRVRFTGLNSVVSSATRIIDSTSFLGSLGFGAERGKFGMGLSYTLQKGSSETNSTVALNLNWKF